MFSTKSLLNCQGRLLDLSLPRIMGIMNVTPDSFYDGGKLKNDKEILVQAERMLMDGAAVLDVGGVSTRPGAGEVPLATELERVIPTIEIIHKEFPQAVLSVDTWRSKVAVEAVYAGASMINDVSAGRFDENLLPMVARLKVPYVLMHLQGRPQSMQQDPAYPGDESSGYGVVKEVFKFLKEKVFLLNESGIHDIIIDPGFGFGKTVEHNFQLLKYLDVFNILGLPVLAGLSRKSMICRVLKVNPDKALNGTTALHVVALLKAAKLLRVHDVKEARETIELISRIAKD